MHSYIFCAASHHGFSESIVSSIPFDADGNDKCSVASHMYKFTKVVYKCYFICAFSTSVWYSISSTRSCFSLTPSLSISLSLPYLGLESHNMAQHLRNWIPKSLASIPRIYSNIRKCDFNWKPKFYRNSLHPINFVVQKQYFSIHCWNSF